MKTGAGTMTLSGDNAYSGGTTVNAGTLQIGAGGTSGSIVGDIDVMADGILAFNRSDNVTFAGLIGGEGAVEKLADGTLTLTGNSNAFAGTTTVNAGTLIVDGVLGGAIGVLSGARLEGIGAIGTTTVASGGTIAPDHSPGTLTVAGDINFASGSTYEVDITPALDGDLIDASGEAVIDGGTVHVLKAAIAGGEAFAIAGVPVAKDAAVIEAGLDLDVNAAATLGLCYSGQIASGARDHGFKVNLTVKF